MSGEGGEIYIENLALFRKALRRAQDATPRELSKAVKRAGAPIIQRARQVAPHRTGTLAAGYTLRASGTTGRVFSRVPYAVGAEWGMHGKWAGFRRYKAFGTGASTGRGRFAWRAVVEGQDETARIITTELREVLQLHGWARP